MGFDFVRSDAVARVKNRLDHPVVDGDGHLTEILPVVAEYVGDLAGAEVRDRFLVSMRGVWTDASAYAPVRVPFWGTPASTLDRLTSKLPQLLYRRLEELGLDFALLYPGIALPLLGLADDELRQVAARALNTYYAEVFGDVRDRLEPVATIPMHTPEEALAELDHAVGTLGLKAVVMSAVVPRAQAPDGTRRPYLDTLGHGSAYDYDPVWRRCEELKVVPAFHGIGYGWGSRMSTTNYVYNHLGSFGVAQEAACRSLMMGGVARRFPSLRFAFLEGGVTWACQLYSDLLGHFAKRNKDALVQLDPAAIDEAEAHRIIAEFATGALSGRRHLVEQDVANAKKRPPERLGIDEFAEAGIESERDIVEVFAQRFFFGCEADDPLNGLAFDSSVLPHGVRLNAMFASDIGHWDVPRLDEVLPEAYELVEEGHMSPDDFRAFTFGNVVRMLTDVNPEFFAGTAIEDDVRAAFAPAT